MPLLLRHTAAFPGPWGEGGGGLAVCRVVMDTPPLHTHTHTRFSSYTSGLSSGVVAMDTSAPLLLLVFSVETAGDDVTVVAVAPTVG